MAIDISGAEGRDFAGLPRRVELDGPVNFRDMGGYELAGGVRMRVGILFRSDALEYATFNDVVHTRDRLGLSLIIDLRTSIEAARRGRGHYETTRVEYQNIPIVDHANQVHAEDPSNDAIPIAEVYGKMLREGADRFLRVLHAIADSEGPVVFHCQAGKDRTGMVAMLVLGLCGASDEIIIHDYVATQPSMGVIRRRISEIALREGNEFGARHIMSSGADSAMSARAETMAAVLAWIRTNHGSIEGYAQHIGLGSDALARLRSRLVEGSVAAAA